MYYIAFILGYRVSQSARNIRDLSSLPQLILFIQVDDISYQFPSPRLPGDLFVLSNLLSLVDPPPLGEEMGFGGGGGGGGQV